MASTSPKPNTQTRPHTPSGPVSDARSGLIPGGRGGPEDELLEDGQEEVFSRTEVEDGAIEHSTDTEGEGKG